MKKYRMAAKKKGLAPGSLVFTGLERKDQTRIQSLCYDSNELFESAYEKFDQSIRPKDSKVLWLDIVGVHDISVIEEVGKAFELDPLLLEDVVNIYQRPKLEEFEGSLFLVTKMLHFDQKKLDLKIEQVSFVLKSNCVISFQEIEEDIFGSVRERIRKSLGKIRTKGADYLLFSLMDATVDQYYFVMEEIGDAVAKLEAQVFGEDDIPERELIQKVWALRRELYEMRKQLGPIAEFIRQIERAKYPLISKSVYYYFRDLSDHSTQVFEALETARQMVTNLIEIHLSLMSNRMNEVMRILTIFAAIFIPLTFIAGIYGMNFQFMPELHWKYGYFGVLGFMLIVAVSLLFYFRKKKWF